MERARVCRRRGAFSGRLSRPARRVIKTDCLIINEHQRLDRHRNAIAATGAGAELLRASFIGANR